MTECLAFCSMVRIVHSTRTANLGIDGLNGVVGRISGSGSHVEYAVMVGGKSYMIDSVDLIPSWKEPVFDQVDLGEISDTSGTNGILQNNGNVRYVLNTVEDIGVDRTTGLPANIYTVIRNAVGRVVTMFPGTSAMG